MDTLLNLVKKLLYTITELSLSPPNIARFLFIFFSNIKYGMKFISNIETDFIDNYQLPSDEEKLVVCNCKIQYLIIFLALHSLKLINKDLNSNNLKILLTSDVPEQIEISSKYKNFLFEYSDKLNYLMEKINEYYNFRNDDGWKYSNEDIPLKNGNYQIDPLKPIDMSKIINPLSWCPLIGQQKIGSLYSNVKGLIDDKIFYQLENELTQIYSKIDIIKEAGEVLDISLNLTQEQKCISEFWAGIGGSVAPPGFWNMFLLCCLNSNLENDYQKQVNYFYELNCGLFEVACVIWNIKYKCEQSRPIQTIRIFYPEVEFDYYFGKSIGKLWLPYQESRLWTPPFCDFVSGHSGFSSVGSFFMTKFFGSNITNLDISISSDELKMLSPLYKDYYGAPIDLSLLLIIPNSSVIEQNMPSEPIYLKFNTWDEIALSAGISRIYGGIHYVSSNYYGLWIGNEVAKIISDKFIM
jgi:hypothetical protein